MVYHDEDDGEDMAIGDPGPERLYRFSESEPELKMGSGARRLDFDNECLLV
jgi:hypothetical protein